LENHLPEKMEMTAFPLRQVRKEPDRLRLPQVPRKHLTKSRGFLLQRFGQKKSNVAMQVTFPEAPGEGGKVAPDQAHGLLRSRRQMRLFWKLVLMLFHGFRLDGRVQSHLHQKLLKRPIRRIRNLGDVLEPTPAEFQGATTERQKLARAKIAEVQCAELLHTSPDRAIDMPAQRGLGYRSFEEGWGWRDSGRTHGKDCLFIHAEILNIPAGMPDNPHFRDHVEDGDLDWLRCTSMRLLGVHPDQTGDDETLPDTSRSGTTIASFWSQARRASPPDDR
jgi:hypothetical protein